jgi:phosphoribosyl-ATP pyrophosphohydrolase
MGGCEFRARPVVAPPETEASILDWLDATFPRSPNVAKELDTCVAAVLEEAVEVAVASGMILPRVLRIVETCYRKSIADFGNTAEVPGEAADVHLTLVNLCDRFGVSLDGAVQARMKRNRSRSQSYYDAKRAKKVSAGLR